MSAVMHGRVGRGGADNRALNYAVLGSLVLHGLLLFFAVSSSKNATAPAGTPEPIVARLVQPQAPAPQPASAAQPPPKPRAEPAPAVVKPVPSRKPSPLPQPSVAP